MRDEMVISGEGDLTMFDMVCHPPIVPGVPGEPMFDHGEFGFIVAGKKRG